MSAAAQDTVTEQVEWGPRDDRGKRQTRPETRKLTDIERIDRELAEIGEFEERYGKTERTGERERELTKLRTEALDVEVSRVKDLQREEKKLGKELAELQPDIEQRLTEFINEFSYAMGVRNDYEYARKKATNRGQEPAAPHVDRLADKARKERSAGDPTLHNLIQLAGRLAGDIGAI